MYTRTESCVVCDRFNRATASSHDTPLCNPRSTSPPKPSRIESSVSSYWRHLYSLLVFLHWIFPHAHIFVRRVPTYLHPTPLSSLTFSPWAHPVSGSIPAGYVSPSQPTSSTLVVTLSSPHPHPYISARPSSAAPHPAVSNTPGSNPAPPRRS